MQNCLQKLISQFRSHMKGQTQTQEFESKNYHLRCTADQLIINGETIDYKQQILHMDKLYIVKPPMNSLLRSPLVLNRNKSIDTLDRRVFCKKFTNQIIRSLERCGLQDAVFIVKRVPKSSNYFVPIIQQVSIPRWKQLLECNGFFISLYQNLQTMISKKQMSTLRRDVLEQLLNSKLKRDFQRLFYMMDNLVLEEQNLRNTIINLNRAIVMVEIQDKYFFQKVLLNHSRSQIKQIESDEQNSGKEDNVSFSSNQTLPQDKEMSFPQKFLFNSVNVIRTCQKLKIKRQIISFRILNIRFFKILKYFFKVFFQKQKLLLLQILAQASQFEPILMWKITFEQGKTMKGKNLKFFELLLTNSMISYSENIQKKVVKTKTVFSQQKSQKRFQTQGQTLLSENCYNSWQFSSTILQKFFTFQSPERKAFCNSILNSLLTCKLLNQELEYVLIYLESSAKDQIYLKKNIQIWKIILSKIQLLISELMNKKIQSGQQKRKLKAKSSRKTQHDLSSSACSDFEANCSLMEQEYSQKNRKNPKQRKHISAPKKGKLPLSKHVVIVLMKIYKILVVFQEKFCLQLKQSCLDYILSVTQNKKGLIQSVRLTLIQIIHKEQSIEDKYNSMEENPEQLVA